MNPRWIYLNCNLMGNMINFLCIQKFNDMICYFTGKTYQLRDSYYAIILSQYRFWRILCSTLLAEFHLLRFCRLRQNNMEQPHDIVSFPLILPGRASRILLPGEAMAPSKYLISKM